MKPLLLALVLAACDGATAPSRYPDPPGRIVYPTRAASDSTCQVDGRALYRAEDGTLVYRYCVPMPLSAVPQ